MYGLGGASRRLTEAEKLSHNIAKRWRMGETRARMGSDTFDFLNTRRETGVEQ